MAKMAIHVVNHQTGGYLGPRGKFRPFLGIGEGRGPNMHTLINSSNHITIQVRGAAIQEDYSCK
jgi:hypothetical protein